MLSLIFLTFKSLKKSIESKYLTKYKKVQAPLQSKHTEVLEKFSYYVAPQVLQNSHKEI